MGRVVDGRVNGAPFAGIVLTAGSVLGADDAAAGRLGEYASGVVAVGDCRRLLGQSADKATDAKKEGGND